MLFVFRGEFLISNAYRNALTENIDSIFGPLCLLIWVCYSVTNSVGYCFWFHCTLNVLVSNNVHKYDWLK